MIDKERILKKALDHYGHSNQLIKAMEELGELNQALAKQLVAESATEMLKARRPIVEELSDCEIMFDQIKMIFDIKPIEIEKQKEYKLARLNARIDDDSD